MDGRNFSSIRNRGKMKNSENGGGEERGATPHSHRRHNHHLMEPYLVRLKETRGVWRERGAEVTNYSRGYTLPQLGDSM